jgi:pimeloyl-ACP methyl ester carboxylesterase
VSDEPRSPLQLLQVLAKEEVEIAPGLRHLELYTLGGLLTLLWHGDPTAESVVLMSGGGMGGLLGPSGGLYHDLGTRFAAEGIGTIRVGYRRANDLGRCVHDVAAAADLASRAGARRFVTVGHSFGGAVAIQAGIVLGEHSRGVVTLATQSAGCEDAAALTAPLLLLHGDRDEILPPDASAVVHALVGHGDLVILPGTGHLLSEYHDELRARLGAWIPARFTGAADDTAEDATA